MFLTPPLFADEGDKFESQDFLCVERFPVFLEDTDLLNFEVTDGDDEPAAFRELVEQGVWDAGRGGRYDDAVIRGKL